MTFEQFLSQFIGKTIQEIFAPTLEVDGSGPRNLTILFTDGTAISAESEAIKLGSSSGVFDWCSFERAQIRLAVNAHLMSR